MDQNAKKIGFINWVVLLAATTGLLLVSLYINSAAGIVGAILAGIGFLVSILSYFQLRLEERERFEKLELDEISRTRGSASLFETADADTFPARRSREQFERYIVPIFTAIICILQAAAVYWPWKLLGTMPKLQTDRATLAMALLGLFALVLFLLGKYSSGLARMAGHRLLRPGANYCLLVAYACFVVVCAVAAVWAEFPTIDLLVARALCVIIGLTGIETLLGLIMEIYRVRVKGREVHLLYESRLVGLLGKPEAILTTAAHALDYQFGFKVSETAFYRFLERALPAIILAQFAVLMLSDCFVFIEPGEQALLERMGEPVPGREVLNPGLHIKAPRPIDKVYRYRTEQIQSFVVGSETDEEHEQTITWTAKHSAEDNLIVANTNRLADDNTPPVNLIAAGVPVQYQITNLTQWAYVNEEPDELLKRVAMREVVRYLASADLGELMAHGRQTAGDILRQRIQDSANEHQLGVKIIFAGVEDIHPPVDVAAKFEEVINAYQSRESRVKTAEAEARQSIALAGAQAARILADARAESARLTAAADARVNFFNNQLAAYKAAGDVYIERTYLKSVAKWVGGARKYVIATTNTSDIIQLNLEDKIRPDLLNAGLRKAPATKK